MFCCSAEQQNPVYVNQMYSLCASGMPLVSVTVRLREVTWSPPAIQQTTPSYIKTATRRDDPELKIHCNHTQNNGRPGPRLSAGLHIPAHRCVRHGGDAGADHRAATHRHDCPSDSTTRWRLPSGLRNRVFGGKSSSLSLRDQTHVYSSHGDEDARRDLMKTPHPSGRDHDETRNFIVCHPFEFSNDLKQKRARRSEQKMNK